MTEPASGIIEAVARLQEAFYAAGLLEPVAIVVAGEEQKRRLEYVFARYLGYLVDPKVGRSSWEGTTIRGMKVIHDVPG